MNPYNVTESNEYKTMKKLQEHNLDVFVQKNHDYGDSFFKLWNKMGKDAILGAYSRISDKYNRFEHYVLSLRHEEGLMVNDESIFDTLVDMANYCLMTAVALELNKTTFTEDSCSKETTIISAWDSVPTKEPNYDKLTSYPDARNDMKYVEGVRGAEISSNTIHSNQDTSRINIPRRNTNGNF